jgi:transcriptional regulator with XRE-family HTH domain
VKPAAKPLGRFGKNLSRLRSKKSLTQEQLAERVDLHVRYLQKLEAGVGHPSLIVLARIKRALGCRWDELLDGVEG